MAITTYAELQTAIGDFLDRDDLTSAIPTFIDLAEADMNGKLRHWRMEKRSTATIDGQFIAFPTGWIETVRFQLTNSDSALDLISQADLIDRRARDDNATGEPCFYAHTGGQIEIFPIPDGSYTGELVYYAKIDALSDSNTSNWVLENAPDAYLYGALMHTAPYLQEDARTATWAQLYAAAIERLQLESKRAKHSGTGLRIKIRK